MPVNRKPWQEDQLVDLTLVRREVAALLSPNMGDFQSHSMLACPICNVPVRMWVSSHGASSFGPVSIPNVPVSVPSGPVPFGQFPFQVGVFPLGPFPFQVGLFPVDQFQFQMGQLPSSISPMQNFSPLGPKLWEFTENKQTYTHEHSTLII